MVSTNREKVKNFEVCQKQKCIKNFSISGGGGGGIEKKSISIEYKLFYDLRLITFTFFVYPVPTLNFHKSDANLRSF